MAQRMRRVGAFFGDGNANSMREIMAGVFAYSRAHGPWRVLFRGTDADLDVDLRRRGAGPTDDGLDGVLIDSAREPRAVRRLLALGIPAVDVNPTPRTRRPLPQVLPDDVAIGRLVAEYFLERGFRQFGYFALPAKWEYLWCERRLAGFCGALGDRPCSVYRAAAPTWDRLYGRAEKARIVRWLRELPKAVGVLACMDTVGQRLLEFCREQGIAVPEQVSMVGVDNDAIVCETADPPLSSVDLGPTSVGYAAAELLDELMTEAQGTAAAEAKKATPLEKLVPPMKLIVRRSSDSLAIADPNVAQAMRFIAERATAGPLDVATIAGEVAVSRRWLEKQFRRALGRTVREQVWYTRIQRAKQLLTETDLLMPAVASRAGFLSAAQLSVVFKRLEGQRPTAFRIQHRASSVIRATQRAE